MGTELYHEVTTVPQAVSSYHRSAGLVLVESGGEIRRGGGGGGERRVYGSRNSESVGYDTIPYERGL